MANYELWYCDPLGNRIQNISNVEKFEYTKVVGDVGIAKFTLPIQGKVWEQVKPDYRIHIYRQPVNGSLSLDFVCFLQGFEPKTNKNGNQEYILSGEGPNTIVTRRIIAYDSDNASSLHNHASTAFALRAVMTRNAIGVGGDRELNDHLSVGSGSSDGIAFRRRVSWQDALKVLQNMQAASKNAGKEIFWQIIPLSDTQLEFKVYEDQLGNDRSSTIFSLENGNLIEPVLSYDYSKMKSYIYVGGRGQGAARDIEEVEDTERTGLSYWGRREQFRNATFIEQGDTTALNDIGQDELAKLRPKIKLTCQLINTPSTRFGVDWNYGDKVTINYQDIQATTIIRAVNIKVNSDGTETIQARAELEL